MKLEEIKEEYAKENEYSSWEKLEVLSVKHEMSCAVDEIAKRYAKAKLEEAAERAKVRVKNYKDLIGKSITDNNSNTYLVDKKSITETPLD